MKNIFRIVIVFILCVFTFNQVSAQSNTLGAQETITANARVLKQITLTTTDIQFGAVAAGNPTYLSPTGQNSVNVGFSAFCGTIVIDASHDEPIRVELPSWVIMTGVNTQNTTNDSITYIPELTVASGLASLGSPEQNTSVLMANTTPGTPPVNGTDINGTGRGDFGIVYTSSVIGANYEKVTIFVGGNLYNADGNANTFIPASQQVGTYTATITINVLYGI